MLSFQPGAVGNILKLDGSNPTIVDAATEHPTVTMVSPAFGFRKDAQLAVSNVTATEHGCRTLITALVNPSNLSLMIRIGEL